MLFRKNTAPKLKVLIVDGDEKLRALLKSALEERGALAETAADGEAGYRALEEKNFDALVCDVLLDGRYGVELARQARGKDPPARVFLLSALFQEEWGGEGAALAGFLEKFSVPAGAALPKPLVLNDFLDAFAVAFALPPMPPALEGAGVRLLIVDGNALNRSAMDDLLSKRGYESFHASDGAEALGILEKIPGVEAALVDFHLSGGFSGVETLWELKRVKPDLGTLLMAAGGTEGAALEALRMGADDFAPKPLDEAILVARVRAVVESVRARGERRQLTLQLQRMALDLLEKIDALNRAGAELEKTQRRLVEAERFSTIGEMASRFAHQVNNPIAAIRGYADLAMSDAAEGSSVRSDLEKIRREADRVGALVARLERFSGGMKPRAAPFDPRSAVRECLDRALREGRMKNVTVEVEAPAGRWTLMGDEAQLKEVFSGLIENAAAAMNGQGSLKVKIGGPFASVEEALPGAQWTTPEDAGPGPWAAVSFADSGPGVNPSLIKDFFQPFVSGGREVKGIGLGLSLCQGIVKSHRGVMAVKSRLGKGAEFCVLLPWLRND